MNEPVIIVGAGPAGLATALQLQRYHIKSRIFEANRPGGLLWNANWVENYPGFPRGISGPRLVRTMLKQAESVGVSITHSQVCGITCQDEVFQVSTADKTYLASVLVIASGTKPKFFIEFEIPDNIKSRIYYEIVPLVNQKGKSMIIVGGGDAAFDYALNMGRKNSVIILNRSQKVQCLPLLWERVNLSQNIQYHPRTTISRLYASSGGGLKVECSSPNGLMILQTDYLIGAIGREPDLEFVSSNFLEQSPALEKRGILHFIGDVKNDIFRQTAIAVGDGIRAAMSIFRRLKESSNESDRLDW